jgi:CRISPR/Cas system CMR subunit Cmr4 (Cas7 group RAMP superfamily)
MSGRSLYLARFVLEAKSPLSMGSGDPGSFDVDLVRDANDLPMVAGASLEGALKALYRREFENTGVWLGDSDNVSRIGFSNGHIVDETGTSVTGIQFGRVSAFLKNYRSTAPLKRDHVKLDGSGVTDERQKFHRVAVPRGSRFAFEVTMWGDETDADRQAFENLLSLLSHPLLRLGGASHRGYGKIAVHAGGWKCWGDASKHADEIAETRNAPFTDLAGLTQNLAELRPPKQLDRCSISLTSDQYWRLGQDGARTQPAESAQNALTPMREIWVRWKKGRAIWKEPSPELAKDYVLPGSSVKGALYHRTLYHWNCQQGLFAETADDLVKYQKAPEPLLALFGVEKSAKGGWRSALLIDDIIFQREKIIALNHVSLDRASQAAYKSKLFLEELIKTSPLPPLEIIIDLGTVERRIKCAEVRESVIEAFNAAIEDLCDGNLGLGSKGSGVFTGKIDEVKNTQLETVS